MDFAPIDLEYQVGTAQVKQEIDEFVLSPSADGFTTTYEFTLADGSELPDMFTTTTSPL